jgi:hypothetical protein
MAYHRSIIQLKADCNPTNFVMVKLKQTYINGRTEKRKIPATNGASIKQILYCTREFLETARELDLDLGPELFNNFCCILRRTVNDDWDLVILLAPQPRTPVVFFTALDDWKRELIMPSV